MSVIQLQFRRDTAANWTSSNPTLLAGELGLETDTLAVKLGNGSTAWNSLAYYSTKILTGSGVPSAGAGVNGDLYFRTATGDMYLKASGSWSIIANLTGPTGATGSTGPTGVVAGLANIGSSPNAKASSLDGSNNLVLQPASTAFGGLQSASDKKKEDNLWYDVTANSIATLVGDDATDNTSAWNTFFAALPVGATVYFPAGTYRTSTGFNISADKHLRIIGAGKYVSYIKITGATGNGFHINGSYWFNTFEDLAFTHLLTGSSVTGGAGININPGASGSAVGTNIYRCSFTGLFIGVRAVGSQAANLSVWDSIDITASPTGFANAVPNGRGILWNGDTINMVLSNSTINMIYPAPAFSQVPAAGSACMEVNQSGAIQLLGGEFIGGINTLLLNANQGGTTSVAAVYATNCFFDQSGGATVKITGANIVNRCKFVQCGITGGDVATPTAIEVSSSGTGAAGGATAAADGIDFFDCDIYPNGGSGTKTGVLINGSQAVDVSGCRISGWTSGITVTPVAAHGYTKFTATGNKLGATNNFTTPNTVGITLNAGSFQYGIVSIDNNDFTGSTTPLTDASTIGPTHFKNINGNNGLSSTGSLPALASGGATLLANNGRGVVTVLVAETFLTTFRIPANGVQIGDIIHITGLIQGNATGTNFTPRVRIGAAGTIADAVVNVASAANTGAANSWHILNVYVYVVALGPTATVYATLGAQGTAAASTAAAVAEAPGNVITTAPWFITLTGLSAVNGHVIRQLRARFI